MSQKQVLYTGAGGEYFVSSEFLVNGWNVASPEVDIGTDSFIVDDQSATGRSYRIQIKTTFVKKLKKADFYTCGVNLNSSHLLTITTPDMYYVFPIRSSDNSSWFGTLYFRQIDLLQTVSPTVGQLPINKQMRLNFKINLSAPVHVSCSKKDVSVHWGRSGWLKYWNELKH